MTSQDDIRFFILPSLGIESEKTLRCLERYKLAGMDIVEFYKSSLGANEMIALSFDGKPIILCCAIGSKAEELIRKDFYRSAPSGTECGNVDGKQMEQAFEICMPDRIPSKIAKLMGIKQKRQATVAVTFEHAQSCSHFKILAVPKGNKFDANRFAKACEFVDLSASQSDLNPRIVIDDIDFWFSNPSRDLILFDVANPDADWRLMYSKLYYVASGFDIDESRLDSVHLLWSFAGRLPNFRRFWTSNK